MSRQIDDIFSVDGQVALITGAGGFLGSTISTALLERGARVIALGRSNSLDESVNAWRGTFGAEAVSGVRVDMHDLDALRKVLADVAGDENVDILVNNAHEMGAATGFNTPDGDLANTSTDEWQRNLNGGIMWPAITTQVIGGSMCAREKGSIINIASMYGLVSPDPLLYEGTSYLNPPGYSAAKAGMLALTRYTASFWGRNGVRANAIVPGPFSNPDATAPNGVADIEFSSRLRERTMLGRVGAPSELIGALVFLASDASSFVTGQSVVVDGGWTSK